MTHLTKLIVAAIDAVPTGKVATYGQIARITGHKGSARQVSWTLRTQTKKYGLPWHRIIGVKGTIQIKDEGALMQQQRLEAEGVKVIGQGRIDLNVYQWQPNYKDIMEIEERARGMAD